LNLRRLTLNELARYPIITYGREFAAHAQIARAFEEADLTPTMALNTSDTDTIKTYALCGLGVAIVAHTSFEPQRDQGLRVIDAAHLFPSSVVSLGVNREHALSAHALRLAALLEPGLRQRLAPRRSCEIDR
jgi:DNA-binding transcriptional LysR family regulator